MNIWHLFCQLSVIINVKIQTGGLPFLSHINLFPKLCGAAACIIARWGMDALESVQKIGKSNTLCITHQSTQSVMHKWLGTIYTAKATSIYIDTHLAKIQMLLIWSVASDAFYSEQSVRYDGTVHLNSWPTSIKPKRKIFETK